MSASCFFRPEEGRAASRRRNVFWAGSRPSPLAGTNSTHRRWLAPGNGTLDWNNVDRALLDANADAHAVFQLVTWVISSAVMSAQVRCR